MPFTNLGRHQLLWIKVEVLVTKPDWYIKDTVVIDKEMDKCSVLFDH